MSGTLGGRRHGDANPEDSELSENQAPPSQQTAKVEAWSHYWASGALHACATSFADNYEGDLLAFWQTKLASLPHGGRMLDIACGNGALAALMLRCRPDTDIRCEAVDRADVRPSWLRTLSEAERSRVRFHAGVAAERLPFADGSFDLVASHYGLEYAELDHAVAEALRVLGPHGEVALVVHHADSRPVRLAREELAHLQWLLAPDGLLDSAESLVPAVARSATAEGRQGLRMDALANRARATFNAWQSQLTLRAEGTPCPDVLHETRDAIATVFGATVKGGTGEGLRRLKALKIGLGHHQTRLLDLCRCALDEPGIDRLAGRFAPLRVRSLAPLSAKGHLLAWGLVLRA